MLVEVIKGDKYMKIIKGIKNRFYTKIWDLYKFYLLNFRRNKLKHFLKTRKGYCNKCGSCCKYCECLEGNHCKIWKHSITIGCKDFPLCPLDKKRLGVENVCSYYW